MAKVSKYFFDRPNRRGLCLGVLPCATDKQGVVQRNTTKEGYPNEWVEIPIQTHLPGSDPKGDESRNHINALTASVVIGLPGGKGTLAEMELAIRYGKKCVALVDKVDDITGLGDSDFRKSIEVVGKQRLIDFLDEVAPKK
jgi:hypothetical protein